MASIFEQMQQTFKQNPSAGYFYKPRTSTPVSNPTPQPLSADAAKSPGGTPAATPGMSAAYSPGNPGDQLTPGYRGGISTGDHTSLAGLGPEPLKTSPMGDGFVQALKRIGAQNWINDPKSGHGGIDAYTKKQQDSYKQALAAGNTDLVNRLTADAKRVGYSLDGSVADTTVATEPPPVEPPPPEADYSWITDMVNNELASQKSSIEQELARLKQSSELAVNQNNTFLQDQMKNLEENRVKVGNDIVNFQNRRGGFYSGGLDYQSAHNNEAFTEAKGGVTKDIAARNADIWGRNELLAQQASENLSKLQQQAPDRIRQLIEEQKAKDSAATLDQNKFALETSKFNWDQMKDTQDLGLRDRAQTLDETEVFAKLTGQLPDGTPTNEYQQQMLDNAWKTIAEIGVVPASLASIVGVPAGTKTQDAIQVAIQQQNANTSAMNASTTRMNANNRGNKSGGSSGGSSSSGKPQPLSGKESINNFYAMQNDFTDSQASKNEALHVLGQNKDHLSSTDYRNLLNWINKNLK